MEEMKIRTLYEKYLKKEEDVSHEELQTLLWNNWITALDFVERSPLYADQWRTYLEDRKVEFPRLIHAQDFLAGCSKAQDRL